MRRANAALAGKLLLVVRAFVLSACAEDGEGAKSLRLSCADGTSASCFELGRRVLKGERVLQDNGRAAGLFQQA